MDASFMHFEEPSLCKLPDDEDHGQQRQGVEQEVIHFHQPGNFGGEQRNDRNGQVDGRHDAKEKIKRQREVMERLGPGEMFEQPGNGVKQQVQRSACPFELLLVISCQGGRHLAPCEGFGHINGFPAFGMELHRRVHVFRQPRSMAADGVEGLAPERAVCPDRLNRPVTVHRHHHRAIEMVGLFGCALGNEAFVAVVVGLHRLHITDVFVFKIRQHPVQERFRRLVVGVENDGNFAAGLLQGIVDVARLGVLLVGSPVHMHHPEFFTNLLQIGIVALVAEVSGVRVAHPDHGPEGVQDHVVGFTRHKGGEHVHRVVAGQFRLFGYRNPGIVIPFMDGAEQLESHRNGERPEKEGVSDIISIEKPKEEVQ